MTEEIKAKIEEPEVNKHLPLIVRQYLMKTGIFDPEKGTYANWSANDIMSKIENDDRFPQNIKDHFSTFRKQESVEIKQGETEKERTFEDLTLPFKDQYKGFMYGFYQPANSLYKAKTDKDLLPPPVTTGGQIAQVAGQTTMSVLTGGVVTKAISSVLPTQFIQKTPQFISNVLSRIKGGDKLIKKTKKATEGLNKTSLKPVHEAVKAGIGETLILPKEYRTTRMIADMFGIEEGPIHDISGIEDKGLFEEKWDGFVDGALTYMGGTALIPVIKIFGKKLWEAGALATDQIVTNELVAPAFNYLKKELKRIAKDFKDLYPQSIISEEEIAIKVEKDIQKQVNRYKGQLKRAETLKLKKEGKGKSSTKEADKKIVDEIKELQSKFQGLEENKIDWAELIKNPVNFEKIKGELNLKLINEETDVIKVLEIINNKIRGQSKSVTMAEMNAASNKLIETLKGLKVDPMQYINTIGTHAHDLPAQLLAAQTLLISQGRQFIEVSKKVNDKRIKTLLLQEELGSLPQAHKMEEVLAQAKEAGIEKATKAELMEVLEEYLRLRQIHKVVNGARSDTGLALRVLQEVKTGDVNMNELFKRMGVQVERVAEASGEQNWEQAIEAMAEQVANYTNPSQAVGHSVGGSFWYDVFQLNNFKNITGMLSTPSTYAVNFAGTGIMNILETQEKYLAAMYTKLQKELGIPVEGATTFDEANAYVAGKLQALLSAAWYTDSKMLQRSSIGKGLNTFVTGKAPKGPLSHELTQQGLVVNEQTLGNTKIGVPDVLSAGLVNKYLNKLNPKLQLRDNGALANLINSLGVTLSIPGRVLLSQDTSFRDLTYIGVAHEHALKRAKQIAGPNASKEVIDSHYRELIVNLPEDIHKIADVEASISVFQQPLNKKGWNIENAIGQIERLRNAKLDPKLKDKWVADGLLPNALSSFILSQFPFIRTPYNIIKQGVQRSPIQAGYEGFTVAKDALQGVPHAVGKTVNTGANIFRSKGKEKIFVGENPFKTNRFLTDHKYRSESLSKLTTGAMLFGSGYWFIQESMSDDGLVLDDKKYTVELSKKDASRRDIDSEEGVIPPAILREDLTNGQLSVLNTGKADPLIQLIAVGAIYGAYDELVKEIKALEPHKVYTQEQTDQKLEELSSLMMYQVGTLLWEKSSLQGLKNILMHSGATGHPYADPGKLLADFKAKWIGKAPYSGFLQGLHRSIKNQKHFELSRQKRELVKKEDSKKGEWIEGFDGVKIPLFETLENGEIRPYSEDKIQAIGIWQRALNAWIDSLRKEYILDPSLDIAEYFNNGGESPIRRGACQMFDLEGNNKGFSVQEAETFQRIYEQMLAPVSWKQVQKTNTSTLIRKLDIDFPHHKRWYNAPVRGTKESVPLDPTMQCHWGLGAALQNREVFNSPKFNTLVHILEGKKIKDIPSTQLKVPIIGKKGNITYKYVPKFTPIKEIIETYPLLIDEKNDVAYLDSTSRIALKEEVQELLKINRVIGWEGLKGEPRFASLQGKMLELQIINNRKVQQMQNTQAKTRMTTPDNTTQMSN